MDYELSQPKQAAANMQKSNDGGAMKPFPKAPYGRTIVDIFETPIELLSDRDIETIAGDGPYAADMQADLWAKRAAARAENARQVAASVAEKAAQLAQFEQMQAKEREHYETHRNPVTITIGGRQGAGKTSLTVLIMDMLASHGLLTTEDTLEASLDPRRAADRARVANLDGVEVMQVYLNGPSLAKAVSDLDENAPVSCVTGNGYALSESVHRDDVSMDGWGPTITKSVSQILRHEPIPAGTDEVTITVSTLR